MLLPLLMQLNMFGSPVPPTPTVIQEPEESQEGGGNIWMQGMSKQRRMKIEDDDLLLILVNII